MVSTQKMPQMILATLVLWSRSLNLGLLQPWVARLKKNWLHHHDLCMAQSLVIPTVAKSTGESWLNHFITIISIKLTIIPVYTVPFQAHPYHLIGSWTQDRLVSINYWYKVDAGSGNWWGGWDPGLISLIKRGPLQYGFFQFFSVKHNLRLFLT